MSTLRDEQRLQIDRLIRPGERVLWSGAPDPAVRFTPADAWLLPFTIAWAGFAVFWEVEAGASGAPVFFLLWGTMFFAMGTYITLGRFVVKARRKRRTIYVLTDQRAIVAINDTTTEAPWPGRGRQVRRHRDGSHVTVVFDSRSGDDRGRWGRSASSMAAMYANTGMEWMARGRGIGVAFYDVADGEALVRAFERPARW
jgi:hypothetical protein